MKSLKLLLSSIILIAISGCGKFRDGTSIWSEGTWLIPAIPAVGALIGWVMYFIGRRSGVVVKDTTKGSPTFGKWIDGEGKALPEWPLFVGIFCTVITALIIVVQNMEK